ncbi:POK8 protein, partial [Aegotheles bennettii]|nr:POK8 protein [Aegotheles bennettii]
DCFFTIPVHSDDYQKFAFSVPSVNNNEPMKRYHWVRLPQDMKNSPITCQTYVAWALAPVRKALSDLSFYHYMDDILIAGKQINADQLMAGLE